jgi:hypothetical protein
MNPIILLIAQYGPVVAKSIYDIVKTWKNQQQPTEEEWNKLLAINARDLSYYEN